MRKVVIALAAGLALAASGVTGAMAAHGGGGGHGRAVILAAAAVITSAPQAAAVESARWRVAVLGQTFPLTT